MRPYPGGVLPGRYMAYLSYCGSRIEDCELNTWMTVLWTMTSAIIRKAYGVGDVAHLGERRTRTAEVVGSTPSVSTKITASRLCRLSSFCVIRWSEPTTRRAMTMTDEPLELSREGPEGITPRRAPTA